EFNHTSDVCLTFLQDKYKCIVCYPNLIICNLLGSKTSSSNEKINQIQRMQKLRWFNIYDISNRYYIDSIKGWCSLQLNINSYFTNYSIEIYDSHGDLIFPIIRSFQPIKYITYPNINSNINICFFSDEKISLILNSIFIDNYNIISIKD